MIVPDAHALENLRQLLALARAEDLGGGDLTGDILPEGVHARASFIARQKLVVCGGAMAVRMSPGAGSSINTPPQSRMTAPISGAGFRSPGIQMAIG